MRPRPMHRLRQFAGALRPRVTAAEREDADRYLSPPQRPLFGSMMRRDQQHGIEVMRRVRAAAGDDAALCLAALLHDCGKGRVALWQRVVHVLLGASPAVRRRVASEDGAPWRRALWRLVHHAALGAALVEATGAPPDVVRMIREQERPGADRRLALLQTADEM